MATLAQLIASQEAAKKALDTSIVTWNAKVPGLIDWYNNVLIHITCSAEGESKNFGNDTDWKAVSVPILSYDDFLKIKKGANLPTDSGSYCPPTGFISGDSIITTADAPGAFINFLNLIAIPVKAAYNDLMAKYGVYSSATTALTTSPDYQGSILAAGETAEGEARAQTIKWIFFGILVLIIAAVAAYMAFKTAIKKRFIVLGSLGIIFISYFIFFGFKKK